MTTSSGQSRGAYFSLSCLLRLQVLCLSNNAKNLLEEVFKVISTAGGPREVTGVPAFHPLSRHDVGPAGAG